MRPRSGGPTAVTAGICNGRGLKKSSALPYKAVEHRLTVWGLCSPWSSWIIGGRWRRAVSHREFLLVCWVGTQAEVNLI